MLVKTLRNGKKLAKYPRGESYSLIYIFTVFTSPAILQVCMAQGFCTPIHPIPSRPILHDSMFKQEWRLRDKLDHEPITAFSSRGIASPVVESRKLYRTPQARLVTPTYTPLL
jgi:hypothetical protein